MMNGSQRHITVGSQPHSAGARGGRRSTVEYLPPAVREAVAKAVMEDATIDEIVALIRAHGAECSRSAVGRHVKRIRDVIRDQRLGERAAEALAGARAERAEDRSGLGAIEYLRKLAHDTLKSLDKRDGPPTAEEIAGLALAMRRIEGADSLRTGREREAAEAAARAAVAARPKGLSPETVAIMRRALAGEDEA